MTFTKKDLEHVCLDHNDDWQADEAEGTVSVMFSGLEKFFCGFFGIDLEDQYPDGWIDSYAVIDAAEKAVTKLYFSFVSNSPDGGDRELELGITNRPEQAALYAALYDQELDDFVAEEAERNARHNGGEILVSELFDAAGESREKGEEIYVLREGRKEALRYRDGGIYAPEMEVRTSAGTLRAYRSADPGNPGVCVCLVPAGSDTEIDAAYVSVYEDADYATKDGERPGDVVIMAYGDPYDEDYTSKDILRKEDIARALA